MTNGEVYTAESERRIAYRKYLDRIADEKLKMVPPDAFAWLGMLCDVEPCPFCRSAVSVVMHHNDEYVIQCRTCSYTSGTGPTSAAIISAHNKISKIC